YHSYEDKANSMKIKQILATAKKNKLSDRDLELLLALVLKQTRIFVLSNPDYELSLNQEKKFAVLLKKCLNHYPLAYLSGQQEFYGLNFKVNPNTLIPRPETELIVDYILDNFKELNNKQSLSLIDVGTGSGCIICALAKNLPGQNLYLGLDISGPALKIAKLNAKLNQVDHKTKFIKSDLLTSLLNPGQFALLSSRQLNLSNTGQSK
ncbi:MAG: peptide chain release factor N(5)-glutamine methyltransferase, partial [Candidatus Falkowbacteria bacterium]|nr:peptide chain release factor N(5)-glutamine methyltransferase [Candidatus Falkowbacteria bacterium]